MPLLTEDAKGVYIIAVTPFGEDGAVDLASVELLAFLGVSDDVESGADALEPLFSRLVPGVGVRVMLLGELAERLADLVGARAARDA